VDETGLSGNHHWLVVLGRFRPDLDRNRLFDLTTRGVICQQALEPGLLASATRRPPTSSFQPTCPP